MIVWLTMELAAASSLWPVEVGQTIEGIAVELGDPQLASVIRGLNGLPPGAQPRIGRLLKLPDQASTSEQDAFLELTVGEVTVTTQGGRPQAAQRLVALPTGAQVCTGANSYALLHVATTCAEDGPVGDGVVLWSDTCITLRAVGATRAGRATVVEVDQGSLVVADPKEVTGRVTVVAGAGMATGTGGFRVHLESDDALRAESLTSRLALLGDDQQLDLEAGKGARVQADGQLSATVDLLKPGGLVRPDVGEPLRRVQFRWTPNAEAFGYRVTLSGDAAGNGILHARALTTPVYAPELLLLPVAPGEPVWWRVAALDRLGFLGIPTPTRPFGLPWGGTP
ncbi:MAG: hypothetical protein AAGA48_01805 [Myxococcota bacterium]